MNFASARLTAGFTQKEAAARLGVDQSAVSFWESGKKTPRGALLPSIARLYGCTVDDLLSDKAATADQSTAQYCGIEKSIERK